MARQIERTTFSIDWFISSLLKLIPSEIIALYLALSGFIPDEFAAEVVIAAICLIIAPFYLINVLKVKNAAQIIFTTLAVAVWIFSLGGGPLKYVDGFVFKTWYSSVAIVVWTIIPPIFFQKTEMLVEKDDDVIT